MSRSLRHRPRALVCVAATLFAGTVPAFAQDYGDLSGKTLILAGDVRVAGVDGERSWLDGGFGKTRFGPRDGDFTVRPRAVEADAILHPAISWSLDAILALVAQDGQEQPVDISEAYVSWRRSPHGAFRFAARAGYFWPPISQEHSGAEWQVSETITPSAINSWVGEEVKVAAVEATASLPLGGHRAYATLAVFGANDTSGTLLSFRGWALHDEKATWFSEQALPPLAGFMARVQAPRTRPARELDDRPGWYARLAWSPLESVGLNAFYYDNRGDPTVVDAALQWGWRTRFANLGARWQVSSRTKLTAQAMTGSTRMGYPRPDRLWVDTQFRSAFLLATRTTGWGSVSARAEAFGTRGRGSVLDAATSEDGWAATLAARRPLGEHATVLIEALHVASTRPERTRLGDAAHQPQTLVQLALRVRN